MTNETSHSTQVKEVIQEDGTVLIYGEVTMSIVVKSKEEFESFQDSYGADGLNANLTLYLSEGEVKADIMDISKAEWKKL